MSGVPVKLVGGAMDGGEVEIQFDDIGTDLAIPREGTEIPVAPWGEIPPDVDIGPTKVDQYRWVFVKFGQGVTKASGGAYVHRSIDDHAAQAMVTLLVGNDVSRIARDLGGC